MYPGGEVFLSEYKTTKESWKSIHNLLLQLLSAMRLPEAHCENWGEFLKARNISSSKLTFSMGKLESIPLFRPRPDMLKLFINRRPDILSFNARH